MLKGITPVIAVILLLLITIAIVGFAFTFFQRTTQTATQAGQTQLASQINQTSIRFAVENVDKNQVYIRNLGTNSITLSSLAFYVNDQSVEAVGPASLATNVVGQYFINDSKLAMLPDPATLKVTSGVTSDTRINTCFYCNYYVGYWKFDEGSGLGATDSSGKGNTGTLTNGPTWTIGKYSNAVNFDGSNDFVNMGDVIDFTGNQPYTLSAWVMVPSLTSGDKIIVGKEGGTPRNGYLLFLRHSTGQFITERIVSGAIAGVTGTSIASSNVWYHVTATYDGSNLRLYVNGLQEGPTLGQAAAMPDTTIDFNVGARFSGGNFFSGTIDDVRVLNTARTMTTA